MDKIINLRSSFLSLVLLMFIIQISFIYAQPSKDERDDIRKKIKASNISSIKVTKYDYKFGSREEEGIKIKYLEYNETGAITSETRYKYGDDEFRKITYKYDKKTGETEITTTDADDIIKKVTKEKFNKEGYLTEETEYGPSGDLIYKTIYTYNSSNKVLKETKYNKSGNIQRFTDFIYDNSNNLTEKTTKSSDDNVIEKVTYLYDGSGNRTEENVYKREGNINEKYTYKYEGNNRIEEIKLNADGKMVYKVTCKFDGSGNKTERILYAADGETISVKMNYKYDKNGNLSEELESDKLGEKKKVTIYEFN
jgi:YD repeat-containing protein